MPADDRESLLEKLRSFGIATDRARAIAAEFSAPPRRARGPEEDRRQLIEAIVLEAAKLGDDVEINSARDGVALRRRRNFAVIKPTGSAHVELGLVLPTARSTARLRPATSSFRLSARITHSVTLTTVGEVDREVQGWLRTAYDQDAERRRTKR